ncbi:MAG TPA: DUF1843 domain-containing protein [Candidatus Aquilonibacter sp.]|jgi:hypothetical protein|nr:DUF1843 domain-containing protein [Candidatus Aquilonibacter sp.]
MSEKSGGSHLRMLYAPPIHHCIAKGDLGEMKSLAKEAENYLHQAGDVSAALETLKIEIAKLEAK